MQSLPNEVVLFVADLLNDFDLISLHSTSAQLRHGSDSAFKKRLCKTVTIHVSVSSLEKWKQLLRPERSYTHVETLIIAPSHVSEIIDWNDKVQEKFNEKFLQEVLRSKEEIENFRRQQSQPAYVNALEEQHHLLNSGNFVLEVTAILDKLPNLSTIKVAKSPPPRSYKGVRFIKTLTTCCSKDESDLLGVELIKRFHTYSDESDCRQAAEALLKRLPPFHDTDRRIMNASALIHMMTSCSSDDERRSVVEAIRTTKFYDSVDPLVGPGFRTESLTLPGSHEFVRSLIAVAVSIPSKRSHQERQLGIAIGGTDYLVMPSDLPPTRQDHPDVCDIKSLELFISCNEPDYPDPLFPPKKYMDEFAQRFSALTELVISAEPEPLDLHDIEKAVRVETLKKLHLKRIYSNAGKFSRFIEPGQWQSLEELRLTDVIVAERYAYEGEDGEEAFSDEWVTFLQALDRLPKFVRLELLNLAVGVGRTIYIGPPDESDTDWLMTREPGSSLWQSTSREGSLWQGTMSELIKASSSG